MLFYFSDLDLDLMTLMYELDLDILKMYLHTRNELSRLSLSEVKSITDRQTQMWLKLYSAAFVGGN